MAPIPTNSPSAEKTGLREARISYIIQNVLNASVRCIGDGDEVCRPAHPSMSPADNPVIRRFIEDAGSATQALGAGRVVGQIYAYLYFSESARTLDDMKEALGISKGSASMGVRQLEQWGAVQRVWVKGDRKDYYTANDYFGSIVRNIMVDAMGKRMSSLSKMLDDADEMLDSRRPSGSLDSRTGGQDRAALPADAAFLRARVKRLREFQRKVQTMWNSPIVKLVLK